MYAYAGRSPFMNTDRMGLDIAVIENGPTSGNPFGHTAIAITGAGVFSSGNGYPAGYSMSAYLKLQTLTRSSMVYVIHTSAVQDDAALAVLRGNLTPGVIGNQTPGPIGIWYGNCSARSNDALDAAGIRDTDMLHSIPRSAGDRAKSAGADSFYIPQNSSTIPLSLLQFNPK